MLLYIEDDYDATTGCLDVITGTCDPAVGNYQRTTGDFDAAMSLCDAMTGDSTAETDSCDSTAAVGFAGGGRCLRQQQ